MTFNGVIETSTGNLLRAGFCDFENDGTFDSGTETYKTGVVCPSKIKKDFDSGKNTDYHHWSGSEWEENTS